ncbi:ABC transporter ATP-binding protein [Actinospica durhamensis]|uniref:ABC transporter ATP-binding protein n=1 Tax=Actinospica durhamensis TaxID=1508375 RepID=A0A941IPD2_9ACTN|nr:ABC transporter ATP-binding protein [Actinospica durhamensis]MBR7831838.1 ABC transporter ATP-binding protein [Actinospica durhamensis]
MRNLLRVLRLPWRCAPVLALVQLLATTVAGLVPVAAADLTAELIDRLGTGHPAHGALLWPTGALITLAALGALLQHANRYASRELTRRVGLHTQQELFGAVAARDDLATLENPGFHNQVRLAQQAAASGPQQLVSTVLSILQSAIATIGFLLSCAAFAPLPTLLVILSATPGIVAQRRLVRLRANATVSSAPHLRRQLFYVQLLLDLRAAKEIRLFGIGLPLLHRLREETDHANRLDRTVDVATLRTDAALSLLTAVASGGALGSVVFEIAHGNGSVGDLAVLIAALAGVQSGVAGIVSQIANLSQTLALFGHYTSLVHDGPHAPRPEASSAAAATPPADRLAPCIRFESVWFRYDEHGPWILRDLDLCLPPGVVVGLVGLNGAGKSTLAKLLCRLYEPTRGTITWDGVDIRTIAMAEYRSRVSAVFQDFMTYDLSAHDNIALGAAGGDGGGSGGGGAADGDGGEPGFGVTREAVQDAAEAAGAHEIVTRLPVGYDSMLSRMFADARPSTPGAAVPGVLLSGGQWQRVALARAAVRGRARLFILDEPAASLDPFAEAEQRSRMRTLLEGKTGLLISHRLDAIRRAGHIVVLREGRVVEQGAHDALLAADGDYARLFRLQAQGFGDEVEPRVGQSVGQGSDKS